MNATLVECDSHLMESAIKNLLYNASRYAKHTINLRFTIDKDTYRLSIEDDGPGIPESERQRVFGSFVQLEKSGNHKGFGLGLAIVKRIVEWHGGQAAISQSSLGGASFTLTWSKKAERLSSGHRTQKKTGNELLRCPFDCKQQ